MKHKDYVFVIFAEENLMKKFQIDTNLFAKKNMTKISFKKIMQEKNEYIYL